MAITIFAKDNFVSSPPPLPPHPLPSPPFPEPIYTHPRPGPSVNKDIRYDGRATGDMNAPIPNFGVPSEMGVVASRSDVRPTSVSAQQQLRPLTKSPLPPPQAPASRRLWRRRQQQQYTRTTAAAAAPDARRARPFLLRAPPGTATVTALVVSIVAAAAAALGGRYSSAHHVAAFAVPPSISHGGILGSRVTAYERRGGIVGRTGVRAGAAVGGGAAGGLDGGSNHVDHQQSGACATDSGGGSGSGGDGGRPAKSRKSRKDVVGPLSMMSVVAPPSAPSVLGGGVDDRGDECTLDRRSRESSGGGSETGAGARGTSITSVQEATSARDAEVLPAARRGGGGGGGRGGRRAGAGRKPRAKPGPKRTAAANRVTGVGKKAKLVDSAGEKEREREQEGAVSGVGVGIAGRRVVTSRSAAEAAAAAVTAGDGGVMDGDDAGDGALGARGAAGVSSRQDYSISHRQR